MIRKATRGDIDDVSRIYDEIHDREEAGETTTGWLRGIYPTRETAEASLDRGDLFVQEDNDGQITGTAILNKLQVDCYAAGNWRCEAADDEVMVIHTLVISGRSMQKGLGTEFLRYYEQYAAEAGCKSLRLDTNARNLAARRFYEKHGYWEVGIVPTVFNGIPGVDLVLIEKTIEPANKD